MKITFCLLLLACFAFVGCDNQPKADAGTAGTNAVKAATNAVAPK